MISVKLAASCLVVLGIALILFRGRRSLEFLRGPSAPFLLGNTHQFHYQKNVGDLDFRWVDQYGTAFRIGGALGEDILMVADAKALQHIFHKSGYNYLKSVETKTMSRVTLGRGILWAHGDDHQRQRKVMNPAFAASQLRSFVPLFRKISSKMCQMWKDALAGSPEGAVIMINKWISRVTLDIIGEAAFDYKLGALDDDLNEVSAAYSDMFIDSNLYPPAWDTLFRACWRYVPSWALQLVDYMPTKAQLIQEKTEAVLAGDATSKDAMSVLVRANMSENSQTKLNDEELIAQMATLMLAGHDTTANTLTWYLWELAKNTEYQDKLREEVLATRRKITTRGETEVTINDLDSMTYLQAGMKETLRLHPIAYHLFRTAGKDDVIPLASPIISKSGQTLTEIPVKAGQTILVSICGYNRLTDVWGKDADIWNPIRFVDDISEKQVKIGMYSNVMTFSAGLRGCIGWRFSVLEMQTVVFDLIEHFRFTLPEEKVEIRRMPTGIMGPVANDKPEDGFSMPLRVIPL